MDRSRRSYRIKNWRSFRRLRERRVSLVVWIDETLPKQWYTHGRTGRRGASPTYSALSIQFSLILQEVFQLPLRETQRFVQSLLDLLELPLQAPDYSTLSRRRGELAARIDQHLFCREVRNLVLGRTGLEVHGEGRLRLHRGSSGGQTAWRRLHLAVEGDSLELIGAELTEQRGGDGKAREEWCGRPDPRTIGAAAEVNRSRKDIAGSVRESPRIACPSGVRELS